MARSPKRSPNHLIQRLRSIALVAAFVAAPLAPLSARADGMDPVQLLTFPSHSRLVFHVDEGVDPVLREVPGGFELDLKGLALADLGAPLGSEDAWARDKFKLHDSRLAAVQVKEYPGGVRIFGKWNFPKGDRAPADPTMETFDYREKNPVGYVLDFWNKKGPTVAEVRAARVRERKAAALKQAELASKREQQRRIASIQAKEQREDVGRFCRQPLAEGNDVFLPFTPAREKLDLRNWFPTTTADTEYIYLEPKGPEKDAQYVRLALKLYRQGDPALTIRTLDFFDAEEPDSEYRFPMRFLRANALIRLHKQDEAMRILKQLMTDAKETPVAMHAAMYLAGKYLDKGQDLQALETFLWLINNHPEHRLAWVFHLGAGEALFAMKQTERAAKEYEWVEENAPDRKKKAMGALRIGDLYLDRRQYEQALAAYYQALSRFGQQAEDYPFIHINRAETLYWLKDYPRAKEAFLKFLTMFPSHPEGWRATYRLGEIEAREKGAPRNNPNANKWYFATINQFPYSPGATLARLRLLPCADHGGLNAQAAEKFFDHDAKTFDGGGEVLTEHYPDLKGLALVRTLVTFGEDKKAVDAAIEELRTNSDSESKALVSDMLQVVFRKQVLALLNQGKAFDALKFYQDKMASLPRLRPEETEVDPDYLLKLSHAASSLGLTTLAQTFASHYDKASKGFVRELASSGGEPDLDRKLRKSEEAFARAKALWISKREKSENEIRAELEEIAPESEFSYGREILLGLMDEKQEKYASALQHAAKAQLLIPKSANASKSAEQARINGWVAELQLKAGESKAALESFAHLEKYREAKPKESDGLAFALGVPPLPSLERLILAQGEILSKQGKWGEAAQAYARALDTHVGGNEAMYQYAFALGRTGDLGDKSRAEATLKKLAESQTDDFWRRLAREALANREVAREGTK